VVVDDMRVRAEDASVHGHCIVFFVLFCVFRLKRSKETKKARMVTLRAEKLPNNK
jgi:hypothetical protein